MRQRINDELKTAMKSGDKLKVSVLRMAQAALKDRDIEARGLGKEPLTDEEILTLFQKMIKQRQESAALYGKGGRADLQAQETAEVEILSSFLPKQLDEAEVRAAVAAAVSEVGAASIRDMGKVMAALKAKYTGRMDFAKVGPLVKDALPKG
jgi:uncharacterized protein YqeY